MAGDVVAWTALADASQDGQQWNLAMKTYDSMNRLALRDIAWLQKRSGQWTFYVRRDFGKVCHSPESATSVEHELSKSKGSSWKRLIFHLSRWKMIDMLQDVAGSQKKILSVLAVCFLFLPMSVFF